MKEKSMLKTIIVMLAIVIGVMIIITYKPGLMSLTSIKATLTGNPYQNLNEPTLPDYSYGNCNQYDITQEYRKAFGDLAIDNARRSCNIYGKYYEEEDIMGCSFDPKDIDIDCNGPAATSLKNVCKAIYSTWTCDDDVKGFIGCTCNSAIPQIECSWVLVSGIDATIRPFTYVDWVDFLPIGDYKFTWSSPSEQNIHIVHEMATVKRITNTVEGEHFVSEKTGSDWGIGVDNYKSESVLTKIRLYQWICAGDALNWQSDMFSKANIENTYGSQDLPDQLA